MRKRRTNQLLVGDTVYDLTEAYRNGARACRSETPFRANPHREGSQRHADWAAGHENEASGLHRISVTLDVVETAPAGAEFVAPGEERRVSTPAPYRVFTRDHDETVPATELLGRMADRKPALRGLLDQSGPDQIGVWSVIEREEALGALAELGRALSQDAPSRPVLFLLDNSGSMRGRQIAALVGLLGRIGPLLEETGVPFEVLGFTTRSWKGGHSREGWIADGRPPAPGRLCDLRHVIYKDAAASWDPDPMCLMLAEGFLKENVDGEALLWAAERARALGGGTILHVTDGTPVDQSTLAANPSDYLDRHLEEVRGALNADPDLDLLTIAIEPDMGYIAKALANGLRNLVPTREQEVEAFAIC